MKREAKIGIFAVAMLIAAWAGIRFLKGFDIFSRNSVYYAAYDQINGVQTASPIMMKGVKIGKNVKINKAIIAEKTVIADGAVIGEGEYAESKLDPRV